MRAISSSRAVKQKCTMRFLIVATAVLACAAAVPSGLLGAPYGHGLIGHGYSAPLVAHAPVVHAAPALPTISPGDIAGAAIDAHVEQSDHVRAAVDSHRELHDQASELQGQAINAAEDHSWQAVDAVKTAEAQLDGAAAGVAPVLAKQLVGHSAYAAAPVHAAYAAGPVHAGYAAGPVHAGYAAGPVHAAYAAGPVHSAYAAPVHGAYGAPYGVAASKTVVSQSLSQTHPGAVYHAAPLVAHAPLSYAAHGAHGW